MSVSTLHQQGIAFFHIMHCKVFFKPINVQLKYSQLRNTSEQKQEICLRKQLHCFLVMFPLEEYVWYVKMLTAKINAKDSSGSKCKGFRCTQHLLVQKIRKVNATCYKVKPLRHNRKLIWFSSSKDNQKKNMTQENQKARSKMRLCNICICKLQTTMERTTMYMRVRKQPMINTSARFKFASQKHSYN